MFIEYGKLYGQIPLLYDPHLDEVFIEENGVVVMRNNTWLYSPYGLMALFYELKDYLPKGGIF